MNLGPSLGTRAVAIGGALAAVVEFSDTYDGGALGNVNIKILPGNKTLTTSSVPLLWNDGHHRPDDALGRELRSSRSHVPVAHSRRCRRFADATYKQGCGDWTDHRRWRPGLRCAAAPPFGAPATYKALFYDVPANLGFGTGAGLPGYTVYTAGGSPNGVFLPVVPGRRSDEHPGWWRRR